MTTRFEALEVPTDQLEISPVNVRRDIGDISELADSIREQGILEPLVARRTSGGQYEVIIGARRLTAAQQLGLPVVPVVVQDISDADAIVRSLVENLQRGDLSLEERVEAYKRLQDLESTRFGSARGLARATGRAQPNIVRDFEAYEALQVLRPSGIEVIHNVSPSTPERRAGAAIPEAHATFLEQAMTAVRGRLPTERTETTYTELARAIAPLEQDRARRVLDYFKMYPERPISEVTSMALATVQRDVTVPAETARKLEELAARRGRRDWGEAITELVQTAAVPEAAQPMLEEPEELSEPLRFPTVEPYQQEEEVAPRSQYQPLELPEESMSEQLKNKAIWNIDHFGVEADFYTTSYTGREVDQFVDILKAAGVATVIDVRHTPVSPYKPSFSKENLAAALTEHGLNYLHRGDLGVPRDVRQLAVGSGSRTEIWLWYEAHVLGHWSNGLLKELIDSQEQPVAFLCIEADPTACHRHLLFLKLEDEGLKGYDL